MNFDGLMNYFVCLWLTSGENFVILSTKKWSGKNDGYQQYIWKKT